MKSKAQSFAIGSILFLFACLSSQAIADTLSDAPSQKTALTLSNSKETPLEKPTTQECVSWWKNQHPHLEAKLGYFFFTDSEMNAIFNEGGIDAQLSFSYPIYNVFHVYASIEYLQKSGHSLGAHEKTSLWEIPLSLGFRPVIPFSKYVEYYFTIGPRYFFVHVHNSSPFVPTVMKANGCGGFVNTGFNFLIDKYFVIDIFGEYSFKTLQFYSSKPGTEESKAQVGGLTLGGGLGYSF